MKTTGKITINDIALAAGVSKATVSRYINGQTHLMSDKTRDRIRAVIEMSNYRPSDIARNLKRKNANLIGVTISDITSPFSSALIVGINECLEKNEYTPIFVNCNDNLEKEKQAIESLLAKGVSGLLVNTTSCDNNFLISTACSGMPVVLLDRDIRNYNFDIVTSKHKEAFYELVSHLKEQGYNRPVLFTQCWENNSARYLRREGFIDAVTEIFGYTPSEDIYIVSRKLNLSADDAIAKMLKSLKPGDKPAIVGINSVTTIRAYKALIKYELRIPEDIGLCGPEDWGWENDMNWPNLLVPHVTTTVIPSIDIGYQAAELLLKKIEEPKRPVENNLLTCSLKVRSSTCLG